MNLHWPQIAWIVLVGLRLGFVLAMHGKPLTGTYSFWRAFTSIGCAAALLWAGGFFTGGAS